MLRSDVRVHCDIFWELIWIEYSAFSYRTREALHPFLKRQLCLNYLINYPFFLVIKFIKWQVELVSQLVHLCIDLLLDFLLERCSTEELSCQRLSHVWFFQRENSFLKGFGVAAVLQLQLVEIGLHEGVEFIRNQKKESFFRVVVLVVRYVPYLLRDTQHSLDGFEVLERILGIRDAFGFSFEILTLHEDSLLNSQMVNLLLDSSFY